MNKRINYSKWGIALYCLLVGIPATAQMPIPQEELQTLRQRPHKVYQSAVRATWLKDTHWISFQNKEREGIRYYLVNAENGQKRCFTEKKEWLQQIEATPKQAAETTPSPTNATVNLQSNDSPDGKWEVMYKDDNIFLRAKGSHEWTALTRDGAPGFGYEQHEWAPDSKHLMALHIRDTDTRQIPLLESSPKDQTQPRLQWRTYAKPGDVLPVTLPVLFDVEKCCQIPLNTTPYEYQYHLRYTGWRADSRAFTFEFNERGHQCYQVVEVNAANGELHVLAEERSNTFVEYTKLYRHDMDDGRRMLWISQRDGWRHLYMIDPVKNKTRQLTKGEWRVREVVHVDETNGEILLLASGRNANEDPYNLHLYRTDMRGRNLTDLTPEKGNHVLTWSPDRQYAVDVYSSPDVPPVSVLRRISDGAVVDTLAICDIDDLLQEGWTMPEPFCAKGRDGKTDIWGTIFRPSNFDPNKSYPVIEDIYAGPHDSFVNKNFSAYEWYITPLVEQGFIVVKIDGMGTNNRSKAFHDVCWKNLKDAGFPDRILWMKAAAARYPYMDLTRVGIYGWSAGGQNALAALLWHGDFYKAAVAFCGCHDNRMDKIWWNELWMGYPVDESYSRSSNVDNAYRLQGDLLLINGELDDNVDPASTLQVVNALTKANKPFEQLYLPGRTHSLGSDYEVGRMYDFFLRKLLHKGLR